MGAPATLAVALALDARDQGRNDDARAERPR
jgi:hypothetical protein